MSTRQIAYGAVAAGVGSLATVFLFDPMWWEIAAAFPAGALAFLLVWVWGERLEVRRGRS